MTDRKLAPKTIARIEDALFEECMADGMQAGRAIARIEAALAEAGVVLRDSTLPRDGVDGATLRARYKTLQAANARLAAEVRRLREGGAARRGKARKK